MMKKVTKLVKQGELSRSDRKDFKEIVASLNESLSQKGQSPLVSSPNNAIAKKSLTQQFIPNSNPLSSNHSNPNNLTDKITKKVNLDETNETRKVKINPTTEIIDNLVPPSKKIKSDEAIDLPID